MYRIETSYTCTIGFVLAAAVRTVEKFLRSPKLCMAEYSISSEDDESVDAPTTSTPLLEITYVRRRKRRLKN